jgi:hypothetical protein
LNFTSVFGISMDHVSRQIVPPWPRAVRDTSRLKVFESKRKKPLDNSRTTKPTVVISFAFAW